MSDGELRAEAEKMARAILSHPDSSAWCHSTDKHFVSVIADALLAFARLERLRGRIEGLEEAAVRCALCLQGHQAHNGEHRGEDWHATCEPPAPMWMEKAAKLRAELAELERQETGK